MSSPCCPAQDHPPPDSVPLLLGGRCSPRRAGIPCRYSCSASPVGSQLGSACRGLHPHPFWKHVRASSSRAAISVIDLDSQMLCTSGGKSTVQWCKGTTRGVKARPYGHLATRWSSSGAGRAAPGDPMGFGFWDSVGALQPAPGQSSPGLVQILLGRDEGSGAARLCPSGRAAGCQQMSSLGSWKLVVLGMEWMRQRSVPRRMVLTGKRSGFASLELFKARKVSRGGALGSFWGAFGGKQ